MEYLGWLLMPLLTVDAGAPGMHVLVPIVQAPSDGYAKEADGGSGFTGAEVVTTSCPDDIHVSRVVLTTFGGRSEVKEYSSEFMATAESPVGRSGQALQAIFSVRPEATPKSCLVLVDGRPVQPAVMRVRDGEATREIFVSDNLFRIVEPAPMPTDGGPGDADGIRDNVITVPAADRSPMGVWVVDRVEVPAGQTLRFEKLGGDPFMPYGSLRSAVVLSAGRIDVAGTLDVGGSPGGTDGGGGDGGPGGGGGGSGLPSVIYLDDWIVGDPEAGGWGFAGGGALADGGVGVLPVVVGSDPKKRETSGAGRGDHGDFYLGGGEGAELDLECTSGPPCDLGGAYGRAGEGGSGDLLDGRSGGAPGEFGWGWYGEYASGGCGGAYATTGLCAGKGDVKEGAVYAAEASAGSYGTEFLVPHLGGSAGGGGTGILCRTGSVTVGCDPDAPGGGGGGGGGAVVLVSWDGISVSGAIEASGGDGGAPPALAEADHQVLLPATGGGAGAGGAVFIASPSVSITGEIRVAGGDGGLHPDAGPSGGRGGQGRVRVDGAHYDDVPIGTSVFNGNAVLDQEGPRITVWTDGMWALFTEEGTQVASGLVEAGETLDFTEEYAVTTRPLWFYAGTPSYDAGFDRTVHVPSPVGVATIADRDRDGLFDDREVDDHGTDPSNPDTDGDGIDDGDEVAASLDPTSGDTDEDGLSDGDEIAWDTDPTLPDTDGDGRIDGDEVGEGTDPTLPDTDGDGLSDGEEAFHGTDPLEGDTDDDGLSDGDEIDAGTDPHDRDSDRDLLWDGEEADPAIGTDPTSADTDGDGRWDGEEVLRDGTDPLVADTDGDGLNDGAEATEGTDPHVADTDGDALVDGAEVAAGTDPRRADTDGDTIADGTEVAEGTSPTDRDTDGDALDDGAEATTGTDPLDGDSDDDGLSDGDEVKTHGTDPTEADTDGGCAEDGVEVFHGTDPLDGDDDTCDGRWIQGGAGCDAGGAAGAPDLLGLLWTLLFVRRRR